MAAAPAPHPVIVIMAASRIAAAFAANGFL
jgi:hypothetical protein